MSNRTILKVSITIKKAINVIIKTTKYDNNFPNEKDFCLYLTNSKSLFSFFNFFYRFI